MSYIPTAAIVHAPPASAPARDDELTLSGVEVTYVGSRRPALSDVDLTVRPGDLIGIAGRTGAGKSTLALLSSGFIPRVVRARVTGAATLGETSLLTADGRAALLGRVGIVFSTPANQLSASKLTVREELAFGLENLGLPRPEMDARIDFVLDRLGIGGLADREPFALSGGEQQRVAIASIVTMGTGFLVLDEPTAQLDPAGTSAVAGLLADLARDGSAILCAEHDPVVLGGLDRCVVLSDGRVVVDDLPGTALSSARLRSIGLAAPTLVRLAEAARIAPAEAFDESHIAAGLRRSVDGDSPLRPPAGPDAGDLETIALAPITDHARASIAVQSLVHRYPTGVDALRGVSIEVEPGQAVAIVGQNGSGKTTLVKHLNGLLRPTAGRVTLDGKATIDRPIHDLAGTVGFVFQDPDDQLFDRSVEREVSFGPRNLRRPTAAVAGAVESALAAVGLGSARRTNPYDLDRSSRKLVALASVLAMDPAILVLDEPTTGQDGPGVRRVGAVVDAFVETGRTVIAVTHDMEFAARHFGRIVVMRGGEIVADGSPAEVFAPDRAALLRTAGLEPPPAARIGAALGLGSTPTLEVVLARLSSAGR
jgi:energy-coupling factor transport system ATP-binding protein